MTIPTPETGQRAAETAADETSGGAEISAAESRHAPAVPRRLSLATQALEALRELVLTGAIPPGTRINEVGLAQQLRISRGPLREAIRHLASEGLLVLNPNRGAVVTEIGADGVLPLFELRTALEGAAARYAAQRRTATDIERLREVCATSRATLRGRFPYRLDIAFHTALLATARSPRIAEQVRLVQQQVILLRSGLDPDPAHTAASLDDHDAITEAVAAADGDLAAAAMHRHLDRVRNQMLAAHR